MSIRVRKCVRVGERQSFSKRVWVRERKRERERERGNSWQEKFFSLIWLNKKCNSRKNSWNMNLSQKFQENLQRRKKSIWKLFNQGCIIKVLRKSRVIRLTPIVFTGWIIFKSENVASKGFGFEFKVAEDWSERVQGEVKEFIPPSNSQASTKMPKCKGYTGQIHTGSNVLNHF